MPTKDAKVLLAGYRAPVARALREKGVEFALWHDRQPPPKLGGAETLIAPFATSRKELDLLLEPLKAGRPFTHVIAAVERSVFAASLARRLLGARKSTHTVIRRCHDKLEMKEYLFARGIPMTPFARLDAVRDAKKLRRILGERVVVKRRTDSGGRGVRVHDDPAEAQREAGRGKIAERFVEAEEMSVETFVSDRTIRFTNLTEYRVKGRVNVVPGRVDEGIAGAALDLNRRVIEALGIEWGLTHLEIYLHPDGLLFGEIAIRPPGGYIMDLMTEAYGFDAWGAFVDVEFGVDVAFPEVHARHCAAIVLAPDPGEVRSIRGASEVAAHPAVLSCRVKPAVGDTVAPRLGVGSDSGRVLLGADDAAALDRAIGFVERTLRIETALG